MSRPLEDFCENELLFLEEAAGAFAERYPAQAKYLTPEPGRHVDPHLERFIEGFALLAGRVHHKLDSEFPELTESLLQVLYPHLGLVIPSMAIAQVETDAPARTLCQGWRLEQNTLVRSKMFARSGKRGETCQYRVGYPTTLWPIDLTHVSWETGPFDTGLEPPAGTKAILRLRFSCRDGLAWDDLAIDKLRLYLSGERQLIAGLYEILFNRCLGVEFAACGLALAEKISSAKPQAALQQVGLDLDEGLLPFPVESFVGYRLLMELLSFPQKFLFVDLTGWEQIRGRGFGGQVEVNVFLSQSQENLERGLSAQNFLLNCTPVVNVFRKSVEPIDCHHLQPGYRVVPTRVDPLAMEVYRLDSVHLIDAAARASQELGPFYASAFAPHTPMPRGEVLRTPRVLPAYWYACRRASAVAMDPGTEVFVTVVDPQFRPDQPGDAMLDIQAWCTNRDLPFKLQQAGDVLTLAAEVRAGSIRAGSVSDGPGIRAGSVSDGPAVPCRLRLLHKPTPPLRPALRRETYGRLLAQLYLNHVSLTQGEGAREALQAMLRLCDFSGPATPQLAAVNRQIIEGIQAIRARPIMKQILRGGQWGACHGTHLEIEFDEQQYIGTGAFLVASVLDRLLGLYTAVNSFTQLAAKTAQAEGVLKTWPVRAGADTLGS